MKSNSINSKPFLKWAGGKTQLIDELEKRLPEKILATKKIKNYIEPFIGGGAFFFYLKNNYQIENSVIVDINPEIILAYKTIQKEPNGLIPSLKKIEKKYLSLTEDMRKNFFYEIRKNFNSKIKTTNYINFNETWLERTAELIFFKQNLF